MALYEAILSPPASLPSAGPAQPTLDTWVAEHAVGGERAVPGISDDVRVAPGLSDDDPVDDSDDEIWNHVESCTGVEADKAAVLRTSLEESLGKTHAQKVLSKTKATVARNSSGHKTRVLQADKKYLRLKK